MRGYKFDSNKIRNKGGGSVIPVTRGQVAYEFGHLMKKLKERDHQRYKNFYGEKRIQVHPSFKIITGAKEAWEK